jgi:hypothetical protein
LALAAARLRQGASTEAIDALPPLEISLSPDVAAAMAFSRTMRWYSADEHLFCATSSVRRAIVSHDAIIRSLIIIGSGTVLRRLRAVMTSAFPMTSAVKRFQMVERSEQWPREAAVTLGASHASIGRLIEAFEEVLDFRLHPRRPSWPWPPG